MSTKDYSVGERKVRFFDPKVKKIFFLKQHSATNALLYIGRNSPDRPGKTGMKITQHLSPQREFPLKRFSIGTLYLLPCVLLSTALSACPSPNEGEGTPLEEVYTVIFDKNGGDTEANPPSKTVEIGRASCRERV